MLPVEEISAQVCRLLKEKGIAVVTAPPGAGKSTVLPLAVLDSLDDGGKILMLEPRRIAARQVAERMSFLSDDKVGGKVGYRIRFETKVSSRTRIEVLTEGILTRMLVDDPGLEGVSVIIFDEFHERSLASELSLALALECRNLLRPDLKILIMSATIDADSICRALDAPLVESAGRMFPVSIRYGNEEATPENAAETVARAISRAYREEDGDILAFLPGEGDIRRCQDLLGDSFEESTDVCPLFGNLPQSEQRKAIAPSATGRRKIVLATPIAETSLTIEGVRIVIDSGLCRKLIHDSRTGLDVLKTVRISKDMATQRSGRAGRVASGTCHRLWSAATDRSMSETRVPEILEADLSSLCLDIAAWGEPDPNALPWLAAPPASNVASARSLLASLGALDNEGHITCHGRRLASLPCHPRIAQMLNSSEDALMRSLAADVAAILEEKDPLATEDCGTSLDLRVSRLRQARRNGSAGRWSRIAKVAQQYRALVHAAEDNTDPDPCSIGKIVALAYPERVAKEMNESCRYMMSSGENVRLEQSDIMSSYTWLAVASLNSRPGSDGRVFLAAPLNESDIRSMAKPYENVSWDSRKGSVVAQKELRIGRLLLDSAPVECSRDRLAEVICEACKKDGSAILDFSDEVGNLQRRVACVAGWHPEMDLPDLSTSAVLDRVEEWLPMFIGKARTTAELKKINIAEALWSLLDYDQQKEVERMAPSHIEVPTGSRIRIEYRLGAEAPVLRVRLQECFGLLDTPCVDGGRLPVLMELLSPGFKPVQLTRDLRSFWTNTYFEVRKELKRRYPKHSWPDNPLEAEAVRGVRKK